jgi:hypothetical protein
MNPEYKAKEVINAVGCRKRVDVVRKLMTDNAGVFQRQCRLMVFVDPNAETL